MYDGAFFHDQDTIRDIQREAQYLFGNDNRQFVFITNAPQRARHVTNDGWLDPFCRFIKQQYSGLAGERPGNSKLLLLSAGQVSAPP